MSASAALGRFHCHPAILLVIFPNMALVATSVWSILQPDSETTENLEPPPVKDSRTWSWHNHSTTGGPGPASRSTSDLRQGAVVEKFAVAKVVRIRASDSTCRRLDMAPLPLTVFKRCACHPHGVHVNYVSWPPVAWATLLFTREAPRLPRNNHSSSSLCRSSCRLPSRPSRSLPRTLALNSAFGLLLPSARLHTTPNARASGP